MGATETVAGVWDAQAVHAASSQDVCVVHAVGEGAWLPALYGMKENAGLPMLQVDGTYGQEGKGILHSQQEEVIL